MELQHFSHEHPLVFSEEPIHERKKVYCSGCGDLVCGPSFGCVECGFYLDKQCAEAPTEMNHPFHRDYCLNLLKGKTYEGECFCDFCNQKCENFVYHCSCGLDLHIKCALFSYNIAEKRIAEFQHIARIDPLISTENRPEKLKKADCFACWKPLLDSPYFSPDCGFHLHAKCVDLPSEINHLFHEYPLILQFNNQHLSCHICQKPHDRGFVYACPPCNFALHIECATIPTEIDHLCHPKHPLILQQLKDGGFPCQVCQATKGDEFVYYCSICKFALHIDCVPPLASPPVIVDKSHQRPFVLFWRHVSFICDACGSPGKYESYICSTCSIIIHKKCISLPRTFRHPRHPEHPISHTYFLGKYEIESWECRICHLEDVNSEHGGYHCSVCNYIAHVKCAIEEYNWYEFDESEIIDEEDLEDTSALIPYSIIKESNDGENVVAIEIKHFSHDQHNLVLSNDNSDDKYCDGCALFIFNSYYGCSECGFFLHKSCAELPRKKHIWFHHHPKLHTLTVDHRIFQCAFCLNESSGFGYACRVCDRHYCLPCSVLSDMPRCEGHEHLLPYYEKYEGLCNGCGNSIDFAFRCKSCNFNLEWICLRLPLIARHKSDEHPFKLTYHDNNSYSESHYCDICEEGRDPKNWFYQCATCDSSAHPDCVLGKYPFIKLGTVYTEGDHPHPLTFVHKFHYYPECHRCGEPCLDLALECKSNIGCTYIVHWKCPRDQESEKAVSHQEAEETKSSE